MTDLRTQMKKPNIVKSERNVFFDVDDTLVMHENPNTNLLRLVDEVRVHDTVENRDIRVRKNRPMIRLLLEEHARGSYITVWSKGGFAWAASVIEALDLNAYVHVIMTKPTVYMDDKDVSEWLRDRVYLAPDSIYKP